MRENLKKHLLKEIEEFLTPKKHHLGRAVTDEEVCIIEGIIYKLLDEKFGRRSAPIHVDITNLDKFEAPMWQSVPHKHLCTSAQDHAERITALSSNVQAAAGRLCRAIQSTSRFLEKLEEKRQAAKDAQTKEKS